MRVGAGCLAFVDFHGATFECSKQRGHDGKLHVMRVRNSPLGWILAFWYDEDREMGPWTGGVVGV